MVVCSVESSGEKLAARTAAWRAALRVGRSAAPKAETLVES